MKSADWWKVVAGFLTFFDPLRLSQRAAEKLREADERRELAVVSTEEEPKSFS